MLNGFARHRANFDLRRRAALPCAVLKGEVSAIGEEVAAENGGKYKELNVRGIHSLEEELARAKEEVAVGSRTVAAVSRTESLVVQVSAVPSFDQSLATDEGY